VSRAQNYVKGLAPSASRSPNDFYPTPPEMTSALLSVEKFEGDVWECACGDGSMSRVLEAEGYCVKSTDLVDYGYGLPGVDFLQSPDHADNIVTNPPFNQISEFIEHALTRARKKIAILGRLGILEGQKRRLLWDASPMSRVWVFSKRIACIKPGDQPYGAKGGKGGMIAYAWYVWDLEYDGPTTLGWL
jgi:hypothetical protein